MTDMFSDRKRAFYMLATSYPLGRIETVDYSDYQLSSIERDILVLVHELPGVVEKAAKNYNPADIANYMYELAKEFHKFWEAENYSIARKVSFFINLAVKKSSALRTSD